METAAHGNRRSESLDTKVWRQKPDPAAGPALASGSPDGAVLHQSTTGTRETRKAPAQANLRAAGRGGASATTCRTDSCPRSPAGRFGGRDLPGEPGIHPGTAAELSGAARADEGSTCFLQPAGRNSARI